jgi:hypothetical protein
MDFKMSFNDIIHSKDCINVYVNLSFSNDYWRSSLSNISLSLSLIYKRTWRIEDKLIGTFLKEQEPCKNLSSNLHLGFILNECILEIFNL